MYLSGTAMLTAMLTIYCADDSDSEEDAATQTDSTAQKDSAAQTDSAAQEDPATNSEHNEKISHSPRVLQSRDGVDDKDVDHRRETEEDTQNSKISDTVIQEETASFLSCVAEEAGIDEETSKEAEAERQRRNFIIHKSFAFHHNPYFDAAFNGSFKEGKTQSITVKADPEIVSLLIEWMYTQKLLNSGEGDS